MASFTEGRRTTGKITQKIWSCLKPEVSRWCQQFERDSGLWEPLLRGLCWPSSVCRWFLVLFIVSYAVCPIRDDCLCKPFRDCLCKPIRSDCLYKRVCMFISVRTCIWNGYIHIYRNHLFFSFRCFRLTIFYFLLSFSLFVPSKWPLLAVSNMYRFIDMIAASKNGWKYRMKEFI